LRILVVNKFHWPKGGSERVYFDLADGYARHGHDVVPFAMRSPRNVPTPWEDRFAPEVSWTGGPLRRLRTAAAAIHSQEAARCLRRLVRETRPDVAHLHNFHHQLSPSIVDVLREERVPAVHTLHDYKVICPNYLLYTEGAVCERCRGGRFHHAALHRCLDGRLGPSVVAAVEMTWHRARRTLERGIRRFVSPSRFLAGKLREFGVDESRIRVVPNGVDPAAFPVSAAAGDGFVTAGRLSREKGMPTLFRALAAAGDARLTVCGTGPLEGDLRRWAERLAPGRVTFAGHLERDALLARIRGARAVVLPSEWYENAPMGALEALASGVPVIGSALGGIPEVVRDGDTGLLFPPGDAEALAARLRELQAGPDRARELGARGRRLVETERSLAGQVRSMLAILEEEVASSASR
jgi:glycosyltransferase involved in cell wall biosynthesis